MSLPDLNSLFDQYNSDYFDGQISKIPVRWNTRLTTTAGRCHSIDYVPVEIDMNFRLFQKHNFNMDKIENTLLHEMVHAYLIEHYNNASHDEDFHGMMDEITGVVMNHRCHSYNTDGLRAEYLIEGHCQGGCGVIGKRARMPARRLIDSYICTLCESEVVWVDKRKPKVAKTNGVKLF